MSALHRQALLRGEWQAKVWDGMRMVEGCPCCGAPRSEGHEPGCILVLALNQPDCDECSDTGIVERSISNGPNYSMDAELVCQCINAGALK